MNEQGTGHVFSSKIENKTDRPVMVEAEYRTILGDRAPMERLVQYIQPGQARTFNRKRTQTGIKGMGEMDMYINQFYVADSNDSKLSVEHMVRSERDQHRRDYDILETEDYSFTVREKE